MTTISNIYLAHHSELLYSPFVQKLEIYFFHLKNFKELFPVMFLILNIYLKIFAFLYLVTVFEFCLIVKSRMI